MEEQVTTAPGVAGLIMDVLRFYGLVLLAAAAVRVLDGLVGAGARLAQEIEAEVADEANLVRRRRGR